MLQMEILIYKLVMVDLDFIMLVRMTLLQCLNMPEVHLNGVIPMEARIR